MFGTRLSGHEAAYLSLKGGQSGLHLCCFHAIGGLLNSCCFAVAALAGQQVNDTPLVEQLLAAVGLGRPPTTQCILEGLQLGCMLL